MSVEFPGAKPWHPNELRDRHHAAYIDRLAREGKLPKCQPCDDERDETEEGEETDD